MQMLNNLFEASFLKRLESLRIECFKLYHGNKKGHYLSANKKGTSIEFADYQEYSPGDDIRYIDWNLYSRLDKLLVKTFKEELELNVHILLDTSKSMVYPVHDKKFEYAKKIAIAFSYIGLSDQSSVKLASFDNINNKEENSVSKKKGKRTYNSIAGQTQFFRKRSSIFAINDFLDEISPGGEISFYEYLKKYIYSNRGNGGMALIISDFMIDPEIYKNGLKLLKYKNYDVKVIQVLGDNELDPFKKIKRGRIVDVETNEKRVVNPTASMRKKYSDIIQNHIDNLKQFCLTHKIFYSLAKTNVKFEDYMLKELPKLGFIK